MQEITIIYDPNTKAIIEILSEIYNAPESIKKLYTVEQFTEFKAFNDRMIALGIDWSSMFKLVLVRQK